MPTVYVEGIANLMILILVPVPEISNLLFRAFETFEKGLERRLRVAPLPAVLKVVAT